MPLKHLGQLLQSLEREHSIKLHRESAFITGTLAKIEPATRQWLATF